MPKPTKGPRLGGGPAHERLILANGGGAIVQILSVGALYSVAPFGSYSASKFAARAMIAAVRAELPAGWAPFAGGEVAELQRRMEACCAPLDYALLNQVEGLGAPTDENIARWIRRRLEGEFGVAGIEPLEGARAHQHVAICSGQPG